MSSILRLNSLLIATIPLLLTYGCAAKPPTIAHIHVGHAITGAHDTPGGAGYFVVAEARTNEALALASDRLRPGEPPDVLHASLRELNRIVNGNDHYSITRAVQEAIEHIEFAAQSDDATPNVRRAAAEFKRNAEGVFYRTGLIDLYVQDALNTRSRDQLNALASEITCLVIAIQEGEDLDGSGTIGNSPREFGVVQLRRDLDAMVAREDPPYTTVDRWYLLNLVRLPGGDWGFRRTGGGSGRGY